ncbi:TonB-dependent receptor [Thermoflexibacter ruber]|uniref:TonB-dependent Receptor Plug Domain n=1 Tax=Thermoflexibacter ruber TaxID=1003 RepID=A0A1I2ITS5_9BACT|nr:TonB-dependent receptor [Thermoflexibacter ruber]SFF43911.1 TonB-dependent Receptor Plug Domain [Thermoflexibacter ruber]
MKKLITQSLLLILFGAVYFTNVFAQEPTIVSGTVTDAETKEPLIGVNIAVRGTIQGTVTDVNGKFSLKITRALPVTLSVSIIGYQTKEIEITGANSNLSIELVSQVLLGQEVVVSASRVEESVLQSPVSVEKMDIRAIKETPQASFYDALQNMKGIDMNTQSLTFRSVNMRGFNANGNTRTVQLIDGMDNQAPGLNFPVGNIVGMSELDLESVEVLPGAASALYGPNAINGIILMNSKNPFQYQGLSANVRTGLMNEKTRSTPTTGFFDGAIRYAKSFNDKVAFKLNAAYLQAQDWQANDIRDQGLLNGSTLATGTRENNLGYNGVNIYGDETNVNLRNSLRPNLTAPVAANPLFGISQLTGVPLNTLFEQLIPNVSISRTGYAERDLADYTTKSLKLNAALHVRLSDKVELIAQGNYGSGTTVYTGADRYALSNFFLYQGKLELKGSNFFVRAYTTGENSGQSYAAGILGSGINEGWKPSQTWFPQYFQTYATAAIGTFATTLQTALAQGQTPAQAYQAGLAAVNNGTNGFHNAARAFADQGRVPAGTAEFDRIANEVKNRAIPGDLTRPGRVGAKFLDKTALYHFEGMYNFSNQIKWAEIIIGGNYRVYALNSEGTLFARDDNGKEFNINEYGFYGQIAKKFGEVLKVTASTRYDKNQNFKGQISPRLSLVATAAKTHNFRASIQTGFRIPTTQNQYIDLATPSARLIGGLPFFRDRYRLNEPDVFTLSSILAGNPQRYQPREFQPERVIAWEVGYKGLINNKLLIDAYYFNNVYKNFDGGRAVVKNPSAGISGANTFSFPENTIFDVKAHGAALGIDYAFGKSWTAGFNTAYNELLNEDDFKREGLQSSFNTPKWRYNINLGNRNIVKNLGFGLTYRWQQEFVWQSSFVNQSLATLQQSVIPAYATLDAQVTYKIPSMKTLVKVGGTNILNKAYTTAWGNPTVGAMYYVSLTFDQFMN